MYIDEAAEEALRTGKRIARQTAQLGNNTNSLGLFGWFLQEKNKENYFAPTLDDLVADDWIVVDEEG